MDMKVSISKYTRKRTKTRSPDGYLSASLFEVELQVFRACGQLQAIKYTNHFYLSMEKREKKGKENGGFLIAPSQSAIS